MSLDLTKSSHLMQLTRPKRPTPRQLAMAFQSQVGTAPPPASQIYRDDTPQPVSAIPEYAPMGGVLIAYPGVQAPPTTRAQLTPSGPRAFGIPDELIVRMQQNDTSNPVHIFVLCDDVAMKPVIDASLAAEAERLQLTYYPTHLHLVPWDTDTFWTRDFGPWWMRNNVTGAYAIAKHTYTTLGGGSVGLVDGAEGVDPHLGLGIFRPNDDYAAIAFSDFLNAPIRAWNKASWGNQKQNPRMLAPLPVHDWYFTGLLDVGGNYMVTGQNKIASSYLVATQNELPTRDEADNTNPSPAVLERRLDYILQQLNRFMGITSYHVLSDPTGTYIGHVDCWGKFLADDKVLIAQSQDAATNQAFDRIAQSFADDGFRVYRTMVQDMYIPGPDNGATTAAYTNSLILNQCVYVPLAGPGHEQFDQQALTTYREALPGYQVIGIAGKPAFPWLGTDAMHCRTRGVPRDVVDNWLKAQAPAAP